MKILVIPDNIKSIKKIKKLDIGGIILPIEKLSTSTNFKIPLKGLEDLIKTIKRENKEIFILINKMIHNRDIPYLKEVLEKLNNLEIDGIIFYDLAILNIVKENNYMLNLITYQNHLNASIYSNMFYKKEGCFGSYITNEITLEEILSIKKKVDIKLMVNVYGHIPISHSARFIASNYYKQVNGRYQKELKTIRNNDDELLVFEDENGSTVFTKKVLKAYNEIKILADGNIEYAIINAFNISDKEIKQAVTNFNLVLKGNIIDDTNNYKAFFYDKTIFKVKNNE